MAKFYFIPKGGKSVKYSGKKLPKSTFRKWKMAAIIFIGLSVLQLAIILKLVLNG